jgi:hypothetical protein
MATAETQAVVHAPAKSAWMAASFTPRYGSRVPLADPSGFVYVDLDEDGVRDDGEPGIAAARWAAWLSTLTTTVRRAGMPSAARSRVL